ncbi:MAG: molybdenum ABC transporter ATP-binding protein [Rhodobacterales bacterium]|nr:MAG: molybdenum ABC transporter ATP-binding protein [Rhodobacterales bacterium]
MTGLWVDVGISRDGAAIEARFELSEGTLSLFGPSGSGKTTILNMVAGLLTPDRGQIRLGDRVLFDSARGINLAPPARHLGYVFQDARLFSHLDVRRNLLYGARARGVASQHNFAEITALLGLEDLLSRRPEGLSGGEKSRVAIGRALLSRPELLLLDEPLAALDRARREEILPYLERVRRESGIPILHVSHSAAEVARLASHVVVLENGRVVRAGTAREVFADAELAPEGAREMGALLRARFVRDHADGLSEVSAGGATLFLPKSAATPGADVRLRVLAQDVILAREVPDGISALNHLPATVENLRPAGASSVLVTLDTPAGRLLARITQRSVAALELTPGKACFAILKSVVLAPPAG